MSVGQMLAHCAEIQEVANGKDLAGTPMIVRMFAPLIRRMVVNERPYPRGTRTHPQYAQAEEREFARERDRLLAALDAFVAPGPRAARHPLFGRMTAEERGWSCYKHLDHHLTQFGV